jgi:hypothetical protein
MHSNTGYLKCDTISKLFCHSLTAVVPTSGFSAMESILLLFPGYSGDYEEYCLPETSLKFYPNIISKYGTRNYNLLWNNI